MGLAFYDIVNINLTIFRNNRNLRSNSIEEKKFTQGAASCLFTLWHAPINKKQEAGHGFSSDVTAAKESEDQSNPFQYGMPPELGWLIGFYLNRQDGANMALTCKSANDSAVQAQNDFVAVNGTSYNEIPRISHLLFGR